jgi:hypothetical protein
MVIDRTEEWGVGISHGPRQFFEKKKKEKKGENIIYILKVGLLFHFYVKCLKICNVA